MRNLINIYLVVLNICGLLFFFMEISGPEIFLQNKETVQVLLGSSILFINTIFVIFYNKYGTRTLRYLTLIFQTLTFILVVAIVMYRSRLPVTWHSLTAYLLFIYFLVFTGILLYKTIITGVVLRKRTLLSTTNRK